MIWRSKPTIRYSTRHQRPFWFRKALMTMRLKSLLPDSRISLEVSLQEKKYHWSIALTTYGLLNQQVQTKAEASKYSLHLTKSKHSSKAEMPSLLGLFKSTLRDHFFTEEGSSTSECGHSWPTRWTSTCIKQGTCARHLTIIRYRIATIMFIWLIIAFRNTAKILVSMKTVTLFHTKLFRSF